MCSERQSCAETPANDSQENVDCGGAPGEPAPALRASRAAFGYDGIPRVEGLSFEIPRGAAVALIGPNGSGKSTLLRGILGMSELLAGEIEVLGVSPAAARTHTGLLPQKDTRDTTLPVTLRQVVTMGLYRSRGPLARIGAHGHAAVTDALQQVGLAPYARQLFGELSGGQQQRGILARALVAQPELLILDEPFNGLDRENREVLLQLMVTLREAGHTILVSTHDLEIAQEACTHALLLASGHEPGQPGHPASFGTVREALTLASVQHAFHDATVELDEHTLTTPQASDET